MQNKTINVYNFDIVIVGGGLIGSILALALAQNNFNIAILEHNIVTEFLTKREDITARVSALNLASIAFLKSIKIWGKLPKDAKSTLNQLFIWDELGSSSITFDAYEIGATCLGSIVANRAIISAVWHELRLYKNVTFFQNEPKKILKKTAEVCLTLDSDIDIIAKLCIGADGGFSWVRNAAKFITQERPYQQTALIAVIMTELPHNNIARQIFLPTGPLALLPLADKHKTALVWSHKKLDVDLLNIEKLAFDRELNNAFGLSMGELGLFGERSEFPLVMRHAYNYAQSRIALVGDAAHTIHPLAGQGANLGFSDVNCLVTTLVKARAAKKDFGTLPVLRRYERRCKVQNTEMIYMMKFINGIFSTDEFLLVSLRNLGMKTIDKFLMAKKYIIKRAVYGNVDFGVTYGA